MGLDIITYEIVLPVDGHLVAVKDDGVPVSWCQDEDGHGDNLHQVAFAYAGFERSLAGLEAGRCYEISGRTLRFRAGSYGGYNEWRADLARTICGVDPEVWWHGEPEKYADAPFFELIHFADNEGTIGPDACQALADDFSDHEVEYLAKHAEHKGRWFCESYANWSKAFHLAAGTGMVVLH